MASEPRQTATREPIPPSSAFVNRSSGREYLSFPSDTLAGSGIAIYVTDVNTTITGCSDSAGNTVGAARESGAGGGTNNYLFAYIAASVIARGVVGIATTGSDATHLEDTTKSWITNEWAGVTLIDYAGNVRTVTSNTATELIVGSGTAIVAGAGYVLGGWIRVDGSDGFASYEGIGASEISSVASIVDSSHLYSTSVAIGTDNISSGSKALGSSPVGIWSACYDDSNVATSAPAASSRSGSTDLGAAFVWDTGQNNARFQFRNVANPGTLDATFSSLTSNNYNTHMVAFLDAATGPIITAQPATQTASVGGTATYSVTATTSGGSLSYQWKLNGANIGGATGSSYTTSALGAADNGGLYSCAVTDSNGTVSTSSVRLFVRDIHVGIGKYPFVGWYRRLDSWRTNTFQVMRNRAP